MHANACRGVCVLHVSPHVHALTNECGRMFIHLYNKCRLCSCLIRRPVTIIIGYKALKSNLQKQLAHSLAL